MTDVDWGNWFASPPEDPTDWFAQYEVGSVVHIRGESCLVTETMMLHGRKLVLLLPSQADST